MSKDWRRTGPPQQERPLCCAWARFWPSGVVGLEERLIAYAIIDRVLPEAEIEIRAELSEVPEERALARPSPGDAPRQ